LTPSAGAARPPLRDTVAADAVEGRSEIYDDEGSPVSARA
jgi:hypothetical protein